MTLSLPCTSSAAFQTSVITASNSNGDENSNEVVPEVIKKRLAKPHVKTACVNCKKAHLACDLARPCKRCVSSDRADTCHDIQHKKRGRPKLRGVKPLQHHLPSTFTMIQSAPSNSNCVPQHNNTSNYHQYYQKQTMTILLSMELCCARVSDESFDFLGLYPQEFSHRSLYDFIIPQNSDVVSRIHRSLLDNAVTFYSGDKDQQDQQQRKRARLLPPTKRTTADMFITLPPYQLATIANGSLTLKDTISFITSDKSRHQPLDATFYLGGGGGADLLQPDSLQHLYIVCILTLPDSTLSVTSPPEQQSLSESDNPPVETISQLDASPYTTSNTMELSTSPSFPELQSINFGGELQLSPLKLKEASILDLEQDGQQQPPSNQSTNDTAGTNVIDSTCSWMKTYTTPSPPLSPSSSFGLRLAASSPVYSGDSRKNIHDRTSPPVSSSKTPTKVSTSSSPSSLFKPSSEQRPPTSNTRQHLRYQQIYQQPHQLYYQTILSSRLSVEAQAFASSTRMLTAPAMSLPTYNTHKQYRRLGRSHSTSNTQFHSLSSSSSLSTSSSSTSSSSSLSLSPSSSAICHSSSAIKSIPITSISSNAVTTPVSTLPT